MLYFVEGNLWLTLNQFSWKLKKSFETISYSQHIIFEGPSQFDCSFWWFWRCILPFRVLFLKKKKRISFHATLNQDFTSTSATAEIWPFKDKGGFYSPVSLDESSMRLKRKIILSFWFSKLSKTYGIAPGSSSVS